MDPETAETVMRLWLEDAEALLEAGDTSEDTVLAFEMFKAELTESRATNAGRLTAMIVCRATIQEIQVTRDEIMRIAEEEMISAHDHEVACSMDGREVDTGARMRSEELVESCSSLFRTIDGNNWDLSLHRQLVVSKIIIPESSPFTVGPVQTPQFVKKPSYDYLDEDEAANGESSAMALRRNKGKQRAIEMLQIECAACLGLYSRSDVVHLSCNPEPHSYCQYCIANLYETAMHDASLFPPRCCKTPIPLGDVRPFFSREFVRQYQERAVELSTINPTYCSDPKCQHFIRPSQITANIATCSKCKSHTCSVCKAPQHAGLCPEDEGTKSLLQIAKLRRWQNCYKCAQIVELTTGCNHIECKCGAQFCYECGKKWKTCACEQAHEHRLYLDPLDMETEPEPVTPRMRAVVARPTCTHARLSKDEDDFEMMTCEGCNSRLTYLMACRSCHIRRCMRCMRNR